MNDGRSLVATGKFRRWFLVFLRAEKLACRTVPVPLSAKLVPPPWLYWRKPGPRWTARI